MPGDQDFSKIWGYGPPQPITLAHFKPQTRNIKAADTQGVLKVRNTLRERNIMLLKMALTKVVIVVVAGGFSR